MAFVTYFILTVIHITTGQITGNYGQGVINSASPQFGNALSNAKSLNTNIATPSNLATGAQHPIFANRNAVNTLTIGIHKANANPNLAIANTASNMASAMPAINPGFGQSALNNAYTSNLPRSVASSQTQQYQIGSYNNPAQTYNPLNSNFASNLAVGNKASANLAMPTGWYPNVSGNSYTSAFEIPGGQQYGLHIEADALEIAGNVAVTGKIPFTGTVSLNGRLPTEGTGSVNYECLVR